MLSSLFSSLVHRVAFRFNVFLSQMSKRVDKANGEKAGKTFKNVLMFMFVKYSDIQLY